MAHIIPGMHNIIVLFAIGHCAEAQNKPHSRQMNESMPEITVASVMNLLT